MKKNLDVIEEWKRLEEILNCAESSVDTSIWNCIGDRKKLKLLRENKLFDETPYYCSRSKHLIGDKFINFTRYIKIKEKAMKKLKIFLNKEIK